MSIYAEIFYSKEIYSLFSEEKTLGFMLRFEAVLAEAQAQKSIIPKIVSESIGSTCEVDLIDVPSLKEAIKLGGNAAIPLVRQLTQLVKSRDAEAAKYVHLGVTSQDLIDTASVLQIQEYLFWLENKLNLLLKIITETTINYRETMMVGRTLLQQARPITFGLKTANWLASILNTQKRIEGLKNRLLVIQLGGAIGSGNAYISKEVQEEFARILTLNVATPWHTQRDNLAEWACVLGILNGSIGKIAKDISLLMQTEIAEVLEGAGEGKGESSTMPHKRNPVTCSAILANVNRTPHLVATILSAMPQEHERSAGLWHSEWEVLTDLMNLTAGSVERVIELMNDLEVDSDRMLANLELTKGLIYAENISLALAPKIGKLQAHELVEKACKLAIREGKHLKVVLQEMNIFEEDLTILDALFLPQNSIGNSLEIIDEILKKTK